MGRGVTQDFEPLGVLVRDDRDIGVGIDPIRGIDELAVDSASQGRFRQPRADRFRHFGDRYRSKGRIEPSGSFITIGNFQRPYQTNHTAPDRNHLNQSA